MPCTGSDLCQGAMFEGAGEVWAIPGHIMCAVFDLGTCLPGAPSAADLFMPILLTLVCCRLTDMSEEISREELEDE